MVLFQENLLVQSSPELISFCLKSSFTTIFSIAVEKSSLLLGLKYNTQSPPNSGNAPAFAQATGIPVAIASIIGKPTPSITDGKIQASAQEYNSGKCSCGKCPVKKMSERYGVLEMCF